METFNEQHAVETYKSLIAISTEGFRALQLLNGGAIVALLTYLGHLADPAKGATKAAWPMKLFIAGLVVGTLAFATSYLTQLALYNESVLGDEYQGPRHGWALWTTMSLALASAGAFAWGAFAALTTLSQS